MAFPIRTCVACGEEFELRPDKPGFANRCLDCSAPEPEQTVASKPVDALERKLQAEANEERRKAIRELLYSRK